jgi:hypothetical protein
MKTLSRKYIFQHSAVADTTIAGLQQSYAEDFDQENEEDAAFLEKHYDHKESSSNAPALDRESCVLALDVEKKQAYVSQFPEALKTFLQELSCPEVYLLDWLASDWQEFPFETDSKKKAFLKLIGEESFAQGLQLTVEDLSEVFPLFLCSSQFDVPVVYLFPVHDACPQFSIYLCDDGNLHLRFAKHDAEKIEKAAIKAGLIMGGFEMCQLYYSQRWR